MDQIEGPFTVEPKSETVPLHEVQERALDRRTFPVAKRMQSDGGP